LLFYRIHGGNTLGEAAIAGRQQDQQLIRKYMLAVVPERSRGYVEAGCDRLVELERELGEVRAFSAPSLPQGVRPAVRRLGQALKIWINKKRT
jgi:hypothetical protein